MNDPRARSAQNINLDWALWYADAQGWPVFPCQGKRPPHGFLWRDEASTSPESIAEWWARWPDANIAVAVPPGFVVLDVDTKEGDGPLALANLEAEHGELPTTLRALTGRGKGASHIWFRLPAGVEHGNARGRLDKRYFDVRGHGGYLILPPSIHPDTEGTYRWSDDGGCQQGIAEIPAWLLGLMTATAPPPARVLPFAPPSTDRARVLRRASAYLERLPGAIAGSHGHDATFEAACVLVRGFGLSEAEALHMMADEYNERCKPAWAEKDLARKVSQAAQESARPWGYLLTADLPAWQSPTRQRASGDNSDSPPDGPEPPDPEPTGGGRDDQDELPEINVGNRQLRDLIREAWDAVQVANNPPRVFLRGGSLAQVAQDEKFGPVVRSMCIDSVHGHLARVADWVIWAPPSKTGGEPARKNARPSKDISRDMLVYPREDLPELEGVAFAPLFDRSGRLVTAPGYDAESRTWLHLAEGLKVPEVPKQPTTEEIGAALNLLQDELLVDFPFAAESDWAHALALLLIPYMRQMIDGPTPIHLVEATGPGSGKGKLTEVAYEMAVGAPLIAATLPSTDDEIAKMLLSELLKGQPMITLDNADEGRTLKSPSLASMVASTRATGRQMGHSRMITVQNRAVWILTGNNPKMSLEIARRCVRVRIVPKQDRPWLRSGFKHDPLLPWVRQERSALVHACLVLIQAWVASGRPPGKQRLGTYEGWAEALGGIFDVCGVPGFLSGLDDLYEAADVEGSAWRQFAVAWLERYGEHWRKTRDLWLLATETDALGFVLGEKSDRSQQSRLGRALQQMEGRIFGEHQILKTIDKRTKAGLYRLGKVGEAAEETAPGEQAGLNLDTL